MGEALFEPRLNRVIGRVADVVAEQSHRREARKGPQQLLRGDSWTANSGRSRNLTEEGIGDGRKERRSQRQKPIRELVDIGVGDSQTRIFRSEVTGLEV